MRNLIAALGLVSLLLPINEAFLTSRSLTFVNHIERRHAGPLASSSVSLSLATDQARRATLLSRNGPYFRLDRASGKIEFGATAELITQLTTEAAPETISAFLKDERGLAMSIWDESMVRDMGKSIYRLQVMPIQFFTIRLKPWVDALMKTELDTTSEMPVFMVQSVGYEPNLEVFPGIGVSADALGIVIEVSGELRPCLDGKGVTGSLAFQTTGKLPPPLRIVPEPALKAASDVINQTLVNFAVESFKRGAKRQFQTFRLRSQ